MCSQLLPHHLPMIYTLHLQSANIFNSRHHQLELLLRHTAVLEGSVIGIWERKAEQTKSRERGRGGERSQRIKVHQSGAPRSKKSPKTALGT